MTANTRQGPMQSLGNLAFRVVDFIAYEFVYMVSPVRRNTFFNGGYMPLAEDLVAVPELAGEETNVMAYHLVASTALEGTGLTPARILDVGCGMGGGMLYMQRLYPGAQVVGVDRSAAALRRGRKLLAGVDGMELIRSAGPGLDFPPDSFDLVVGVESPTVYGAERFLTDAMKVTQSGGIISIKSGYGVGDHAEIEGRLRRVAGEVGLEMLLYQDVTPGCIAALKADIPRREEMLKGVPWPFSIYGRRWADMPGTKQYEEYTSGKRADFVAAFRKP